MTEFNISSDTVSAVAMDNQASGMESMIPQTSEVRSGLNASGVDASDQVSADIGAGMGTTGMEMHESEPTLSKYLMDGAGSITDQIV